MRNRRFTLLGLTVLMTILSVLSIQVRPASAGCFQFCGDWAPNGDCCFFSGHTSTRYHRQCTDGVGNYCDEYMCSTPSPCAV
jgi:hypothetical protein